jgi:hypothetical protein
MIRNSTNATRVSFNRCTATIYVTFCLSFSAPAAAGQERVRERAEGREEVAQRKVEEAQRRLQAVDVLKGVVEGTDEIRETRTRVSVITSALDLLWKHDEAYVRARYIKAAAALSDRFASETTDKRERSEIRASMGILLKSLARHDPQAAERLLDKFQKLLENLLKGNSVSPAERLSLAQAGLESDAAQSAALAAKVLEAGVPGSFPAYLNELEQHDPAAAASLFRTALSILSRGRVYTPSQVTVLSAYVFRESYMSIPVANGGRDGARLEFGTFASPLSPPSKDLNRPLVDEYFATASSYLNAEMVGLEQQSDPDAVHVAFCFFLVKKLRGYAERLGLDRNQQWAVLDAKYTILAERAKLTGPDLNNLAMVAQTIVTENTVFRFDSGDAAFAAAEKATNPAERAELLAAGIRQLIDGGKYAEAAQKIDEVQDEKIRAHLNTYRSFHMAEASLRKLDWYGFNAHLNRVTDAELRTYLVLSAALAAGKASKKEMSSEFLTVALASLAKIEDTEVRAAALVATAGLIYTADAEWGAQVLGEGVKAINRADGYDGRVYGATIEAPKYKVWFPIPNADLSYLFAQAAKRDWQGALAAAQGIESKALRAQAYIAACRHVL